MTPSLSRSTVDRCAELRDDDAALAAAWAGDRARVLVVDDGRTLVDGTDLLLVRPDEVDAEAERYFLGRDDEADYFAVLAPLPRRLGLRPVGLRDVGAFLGDRDAGLLVHAVALANWHAAHPRCARCGVATTVIRAGHARRCPDDGTEHFPRTDPAVIMLVHDGGDRCLLGRQRGWPPGRYSTLAGFVEPGESLEQAVVREVAEEAGVAVTDVRYEASQPWPFPSSLMLGFTARATTQTVDLRDGELEDARWFSVAELTGGDVPLPPPVSIAHALVTGWLASRSA